MIKGDLIVVGIMFAIFFLIVYLEGKDRGRQSD